MLQVALGADVGSPERAGDAGEAQFQVECLAGRQKHLDHVRLVGLSAEAALLVVLDDYEAGQALTLLAAVHEPSQVDLLAVECGDVGVQGQCGINRRMGVATTRPRF